MPEVFPTRIISFSSEDKAFPASNLLKKSSFSKWKSEKGGSKQEVVEFDFGQPVEFSRLDIGNNGSAFIEVSVRRSASSEEPTVFLPSASFMSPVEAKNETNLNRVRVFSRDSLSQNAIHQKWDIVKLVCSQPFNKTLQFGLSFVSFHSPTAASDGPGKSTSIPTTVSVNMLEEDPSSDPDLRPGSLFRASKFASSSVDKNETCSSHSVADKLRAANTSNSPVASVRSAANAASPLLSTPRQSLPTEPAATSTSRSARPVPARPQDSSGRKTSAAPPSTTSSPSASQATPSAWAAGRRRTAGDPSPLSGVVFCLSGYQNPLRSEIRDKALRLGATFRQDWSDECTHLICAFQNTPKFSQVKGRGFIVSGKWITKCHETCSRVDWRPYRVGRAPSPKQSSSVSSQRTRRASTSRQAAGDDVNRTGDPVSEADSSPASQKRRRTVRRRGGDDDDDWKVAEDDSESEESEDDEESEESEDAESEEEPGDSEEDTRAKKRRRSRPPAKKSKQRNHVSASDNDECSDDGPEEQDTDDEIQRAIRKSWRDQGGPTVTKAEEERNALDLPDLFEGKHFFIHNKAIPTDEERLLRRLIVAFAGTLHSYMHPEVQFVVTRSSWNSEFDEALSANADLLFVLPDWILACDQEAACLPHSDFLLAHG